RRVGMLPELVEAAQAWLGLGREELMAFLGTLQEKVAQLADLMSVNGAAIDHAEVLRQAHARLVEVAADAAAELGRHSLEPSPGAFESPTVWALSQTVASYAQWHVSAADPPSSSSSSSSSSMEASMTARTSRIPGAPKAAKQPAPPVKPAETARAAPTTAEAPEPVHRQRF